MRHFSLIIAALVIFISTSSAQIVINEIMYYPSSLNNDDEYIELFNPTMVDVDISNWGINDGIRFSFPPATIIQADGYLVLSASPGVIQKLYPDITVVGPFKGKLSNDGETIRLFNGLGKTIDSVLYQDEGGWPPEADGLGASIERINPSMSSNQPESWRKGPDGGTPGGSNSTAVASPIPIVKNVTQNPKSPSSSDAVTVFCQMDHPLHIQEANVWFKLEQETLFITSEMYDDGNHNDGAAQDGLWASEIPAQVNGSVIEFYIEAIDTDFNSGYFPIEGEVRSAIYRVDDEVYQTDIPLYRIIMRDEDEQILRTRDAQSTDELDSTFIYNDAIQYNVGVRFRGKGSRWKEPKSYRVNFSQHKYFNSIRKLNLNAIEPHRQYVGMECFKLLQLPAPNTQFISLVFNKRFVPNYIEMERTDKDMMERQFGDESGNLYRGVEQANMDYRGDDPNNYRYNYEKITNELEDDYSDIIRLCAAFSATEDNQFVEAIQKNINVRQWLRWFALKKILNDLEGGLSKERGDDYYMYNNPNDDLFYLLPWDLDSIIVRPFRSIFQYDTPAIKRFLTHPEIARFYYAELANILDNEITQEKMDSIIDRTSSVTSEDIRNAMKQVSRELREFIQSSIPRSLTAVVNQESGVVVVPDGVQWRFFRGRQAIPADWNQNGFDDSSWETGPSGFGYGDNDDRTILNDMQNQYSTVFIRKTFQIDDPENFARLILHILYDDGFAAYLNGTEIARNNFSGTPESNSLADGNHEAQSPESFSIDNASSLLLPGENVLALVGINVNLTSSDFSLAVQLDGATKEERNIELKGNANAILTQSVQVNGAPVSYIPWKAEWSYPYTLQPGKNSFHIESFNTGGQILEATDIVVNWLTEPVGDVLEIHGDEIWTTDQSPIMVNRNIIIPSTSSLTIEPGITFRMAPAASIIVYGTLIVNGEADSPVQFLPENTEQNWGVIAVEKAVGTVKIHHAEFTQTSPTEFEGKQYPAAITINNSTIEVVGCFIHDISLENGAGAGIEAHNSNLTIRANHFLNLGEMLHCSNCFSIVENNHFENAIGYSDAIDFDGELRSGSVIRGNVISGSGDDGIDLGLSSPLMERNWIENCADKGISLEGNSTPIVINSVIAGCDIGIAIKDKCNTQMIHTTIVSCKTGIGIYEKNANQGGGTGEIINCIIWDTETSLDVDGASQVTLSHSDLMQLPSNLIESNFSINPEFVDIQNNVFSLLKTSLLIDQGIATDIKVDLNNQERPFGSAPDIGAYELQENTIITNWYLY